MPFFDSNGHDWGNYYQLDGWGIFQIVFAVLYTILVLGLSGVLWTWRNHPVIRMRRVPLAIAAVLVLQVYVVMVLLVYSWNGRFPCSAEFWIMSIYLPIGIGLFQASNQQLLRISRSQQLMITQDTYKTLPSGKNRREYYWSAFLIWARSVREQHDYEGFLAVGMVAQDIRLTGYRMQFTVSIVIFMISRRFNSYGIVSQSTSPELCRRGWEWAPSIIWQAAWNYIAGPYLLYQIRMIHDIYHWRLQTTLAVLAGLPGTPLWLAAVYSDKLAAVNKYWVPALWLVVPGLIMMQMTCLLGPLRQCFGIFKDKRAKDKALAEFDHKAAKVANPDSSVTTTSVTTRSSRGIMFTFQSLEECLNHGPDFSGFYHWCTNRAFNGENVKFCDKVIKFKHEWTRVFCPPNQGLENARRIMYRVALEIYLGLVNDDTSHNTINIEAPIKRTLRTIFADAGRTIAYRRRKSTPASSTPMSAVSPWETSDPLANAQPLRQLSRPSLDKGSSTTELISDRDEDANWVDPDDPCTDITVPEAFDETCFDAAMASVKNMLWQQPWQDFMRNKRASASAAASASALA
ncbi:MAG: hypothetical protein Q9188_003807 [Gyalolechia gomerana]